MEKILWAYDGSEESKAALKYVKFLAKRFDAEIKGIYVNAAHTTSLFFYQEEHDSLKDIVEKSNKEFRSRFDSITASLSKEGINFEGEVLTGDPSAEIIKKAKGENIDLIVMGKRGQGLVDRMLIGSTTVKVLREGSIPVLAAKNSNVGSRVKIKNILVPVNISEESNTALNYAIELAAKLEAKILAIYVFWIDRHDYYLPPQLLDDLIQQSESRLLNRVEEVKQSHTRDENFRDLDIEVDILHGISPGIMIANYAYINNIDLIVMNTHGRRGIKKLVLGSETEKAIQNSICSVLALNP